MTPTAYFCEIFCRSIRAAEKAVHKYHTWALVIAGILIIGFTIHFEHYAWAIALPCVVFLAVFIGSFFYQGYVLYREEWDKRIQLEKQPEDHGAMYANWREEDIRKQLARLSIPEKHAMNELVLARSLTQEQLDKRLRENVHSNMSQVSMETIENKVDFVKCDFSGAWYILPEVLPIVEKILPTL